MTEGGAARFRVFWRAACEEKRERTRPQDQLSKNSLAPSKLTSTHIVLLLEGLLLVESSQLGIALSQQPLLLLFTKLKAERKRTLMSISRTKLFCHEKVETYSELVFCLCESSSRLVVGFLSLYELASSFRFFVRSLLDRLACLCFRLLDRTVSSYINDWGIA